VPPTDDAMDDVDTSPRLAAAVLIREATALDAHALAAVHVESWRAAYRGIIDDDELAALSVDRQRESNLAWFRAHAPSRFMRVAVDENARVLGYAMAGPARCGAPTRLGEIYLLYLLPRAQRRGIGARLLRSMARGLDLRGMDALQVWALERNPARAFYERHGGRVVAARETRVGRQRLQLLAYRWDSLSAAGTRCR